MNLNVAGRTVQDGPASGNHPAVGGCHLFEQRVVELPAQMPEQYQAAGFSRHVLFIQRFRASPELGGSVCGSELPVEGEISGGFNWHASC